MSVIMCVLLAFFSDYYNLILIVSSALDWVLKGICSLFLICDWVKTKHLYIYLLSAAQHFQKLAKLERQSLFKCVYVTNIFMINWIPSLSYIFIMVRHLLYFYVANNIMPSLWLALMQFYLWKKMTATADTSMVSNSARSCDLAFSFLQIERIDQLFTAGGLRHLIFYYQDVDVAETGIQTWCYVTHKCVARFIQGWHEAEGHPWSWHFHLGPWDRWATYTSTYISTLADGTNGPLWGEAQVPFPLKEKGLIMIGM